jgi:hypothetical protein
MILLERRELSLKFTEAYDRLLEGIDDLELKNIVRIIIREEYPSADKINKGRSHREDLVVDLERTGLSRDQIICHEPSIETVSVVESTMKYLSKILKGKKRNLVAASFIRFWGEILTAIEYESLWKSGLKRYFRGEADSIFYWYHFEHDRSKRTFSKDMGAKYKGGYTHSDMITARLSQIIEDDEDIDLIIDTDSYATNLKIQF